MTDNLDILFSDDFRRAVEQNLSRDPIAVALDRHLSNAAEVASQVKYLRRAETKLPSYYSARCIVPPLAFEQSSSELTAARKVDFKGKLCLDLTCGLGVDSLYLARNFEHVVALEKDTKLAEIARENFRRLGVKNIEVFNTSAEDFFTYAFTYANRYAVRSHTGADLANASRYDLVYADPDRRSTEGKKLLRLEDCSPDIIALLPDIQRVTRRLVVKLSPLFDVDEVFRIFPNNTRVEVVSLDGECKEIVAEISFHKPIKPTIKAVAIGVGETEYAIEKWNEKTAQQFEPQRYSYLIIPDVALQKSRLARRYFSERGCFIESDNGYAFAVEKPENNPERIMGRVLKIERFEPFDPKKLKVEKIKNIDILRRDFPLTTTEIARQIGVKGGGARKIAFTKIAGKMWSVMLF